MQFYPAFQSAGVNNISDVIKESINTRYANDTININWSYNSVGDRQVPAGLIPATLVAMTSNPANTLYSNATLPKTNETTYSSYNNLSQTFSGSVKGIGLTSATNYIGNLISIDPTKNKNQLLRIVARSGATASSTLRIYITNSTTIYKQIDITLPLANTEYVIDDISWLNNATYGVVNVPVTVDGVSKGTTTAVVTNTGVLPANGTYNAILVVGTLGAIPLSTQFYSNELQKYGMKVVEKFCCYTEILAKFSKELQDILCKTNVVSSYTKSKSAEVTLTAQKWSLLNEARLSGSDVFEETIKIRKTLTNPVFLNGANNVVSTSSNDLIDVSINCTPLQRTIDNLNSSQLLDNQYSYNTTNNQIVVPLSVTVGTTIEIGYNQSVIAISYDPMQMTGDFAGVIKWEEKSTDLTYGIQYALVYTSASSEKSLNDDGNTMSITFKVDASEKVNKVSQYKL
jgi:hypothetical protein